MLAPTDQDSEQQADTCSNANCLPWILVHVLIRRLCRLSCLISRFSLNRDKSFPGLMNRSSRSSAYCIDFLAGLARCGLQQCLCILNDRLQITEKFVSAYFFRACHVQILCELANLKCT